MERQQMLERLSQMLFFFFKKYLFYIFDNKIDKKGRMKLKKKKRSCNYKKKFKIKRIIVKLD